MSRGQGFRRITREELAGFDRESRALILDAVDKGVTARVSSKGHCILRNSAGSTTAVARNMTSPNRTAQNARAAVKRLLSEHERPMADDSTHLARPRVQTMTVAEALVEHPREFSRWFDALDDGLPADHLIEIHSAPDAITFTPLAAPSAPASQTRTTMPASTKKTASRSTAQTDDADQILARVREALGEDPRITELTARIDQLETELIEQTQRAETAEERLETIRTALSS